MPEFVLDLGEAADVFNSLDEFTQGYIEAAFFTECEHGTTAETWVPENHSSLPGDATFEDLSPEALESIRKDCADFQWFCGALLRQAIEEHDNYSLERAGSDFWYTRNGHGVGFWDRGLGDTGESLSKAAKTYGSSDVYLGDDNKIYVS